MTYSEVLQAARGCSGPYCKACPVCNGRACGSSMPGPGAKGTGTVAVRNYEAWQSIRLDLDTICENKPVDTRYTFFGQQYDLPVFAGPVGATKLHHIEGAARAVELALAPEEIFYLEELYAPHKLVGVMAQNTPAAAKGPHVWGTGNQKIQGR